MTRSFWLVRIASKVVPATIAHMRSLMQGALAIACLVAFGALFEFPLANAQKQSPPDVPAAIRAPADERVVFVAHASGSQIYTCQSAGDGKFAWTLKGPDAELRDAAGKVIGKHFAGPTWKFDDGSEVTAKAVAHVDSPDLGSVPWLLLNAVAHNGKGLLTNVSTIQRIHTHGGQPPSDGCDASRAKAETKISYTADYYFYAPAS